MVYTKTQISQLKMTQSVDKSQIQVSHKTEFSMYGQVSFSDMQLARAKTQTMVTDTCMRGLSSIMQQLLVCLCSSNKEEITAIMLVSHARGTDLFFSQNEFDSQFPHT